MAINLKSDLSFFYRLVKKKLVKMAISDMKSRHAVLCGKHVAASCCFMRK